MSIIVGLPMPQPGETITEGVVVRWLKKVGETVAEKEPVVELETAKAVYDYESPIAGTLTKIITPEGSEQKVGQPLAYFSCDDTVAKKYLRLGVAVEIDAQGEAVKGTAKIGASMGFDSNAATVASKSAPTVVAPTSTTAKAEFPAFILAIAAEHKIGASELATMRGTGLGGRLTKQDVVNYATASSVAGDRSPETATASPVAGDRSPVTATPNAVTAVTGDRRPATDNRLPLQMAGATRTEPGAIRRRIAENMVLSKMTIPHAGSAVSIDMTDLIAFRESTKAAFEKQHGAKLRLAPFFIFAVREGLKKFPVCNNFYFIDAAGKHTIEAHPFINFGIAVGTPKGLLVPVLKNAQDKDFVTLAKESHVLMEKAAIGKLSPDEMTGATLTINNPGALGSVRGHQVIPYPQSAIIGFQAILELPRFVHSQCVPRQIMEVNISFDHRLIDGVEAVGLIRTVQDILETPKKYF